MTDLEKAEKWLGVSAPEMFYEAMEAVRIQAALDPETDSETMIRVAVNAVLIAEYHQRIRMHSAQSGRKRH